MPIRFICNPFPVPEYTSAPAHFHGFPYLYLIELSAFRSTGRYHCLLSLSAILGIPMNAAELKELALSSGFDLAGVATAGPLPEAAHYLDWAARGLAGRMGYLTDHRADKPGNEGKIRDRIKITIRAFADTKRDMDVDPV